MENIMENFTCTDVTDESPKAKPQCKICPNVVFDNKPLLTEHINMYHKKDDKYACHKCDDTFINFSTLTQHYTRHHSQPSTSIGLTGEASTRDTYECKICPAVFHNKTLLMQHNKKYHKQDGKYACHKCDHTYKSIISLTNHYINEHSQPLTSTGLTGEASTIATYKCNICDVCYEDNYSLSEHKKETHMIYTCDKCNYKNKDFTSFTQHMKEDHPQPSTSTGATGGATTRAKYQCEICNKYDFEKQTSLDSHIKKDHMKCVCDQCEFTHKYFSRLTRHFKAIHAQLSTNTDETDKSSSKAKHSCKICYDVFENRHSLSSHIKKHHKNYVCHKCTCRCKTFTMLTKHVKTCEHPQPSTSCIIDEASTRTEFQCKVCYCICKNKESLKVHKKVHILYICNKCDYENKDLIAAKKHGRHKHSHPSIRTDITDKASTRIEFRCNICDASFENQLSLSLHKKGHYTIYACTYCTYIDKALNNVTQHVKLEHPQPWTSTGVTDEASTKAKYQCKICYNVYEKKKLLNSHIRENHKYYACNKCTYRCETFTTLMKHVKTCGHPQPSTSTSITDEASTIAKYQCKICGESCRSTETLEMHYYNCHKKDNKFACTKCIYTGIKLDHVVTHIRSFHSSTSIFCVVCEKWFTTKYEYTTHQVVHKDLSELNKFDCPKCNKKYKYFSALEAHYNRMHFSRSV